MINNSPYLPNITVREPAMLFGRTDEPAQLAEAIRNDGSTAVVGLERIAIVYLDVLDAEGEKVFPSEDFVFELELLAKWEPAGINRWASEWGYLRLLVTLEDSSEE